MLGQIPPWLNVGPTDYLHAIQAGTNTGLQVAEAQNRAQAAIAARVLAQQQQAQRAWEFNETLRQQAAEHEANRDIERQKMEETGKYHTGLLDWHTEQARLANEKAQMDQEHKADVLGLRAQHYSDLQDWRQKLNEATLERLKMQQEAAERRSYPTEYETITETVPATGAQPAQEAQAFRKRDLLGIPGTDWIVPDIQAQEARPAVPARGEQVITRRVPLKRGIGPAPTPTDELTDEEYAAGFGIPSSASEEPRVTSKAEYDALDHGTIYIGKDGKRYRKP